ncbi:serine/threonine-protein kinase [Ktedonobacter racemifer]|uniref:non-specific serine/threonine protein kinase n=1 Tax=Ktedonobacter racemifer DSM 44963 TaxID=485913 RepID=D6U7K7_KTERA|nr:serine/threonine-protein kinase [Ktedonobacter racemifer]EFH79868.1 serine/threonine protein kinase [Ktedonobacter racemifer DSM 44963]
MAEQRSREGQRLGNYRLERLLGRGGFAEVYLGRHIHLQRPAAIKILQAHLSEREIDGFRQEAQIIAMLEHPHIVRIHDFDVQDGVPFLVMEYLPNGTMRQRHAKGERVPLPSVVSYVRQVADALQFAHDQRLIHRDVKPENMLLGRRDEVVLSDFGIASIAHSTSSMTVQSAVGTIPYMAPEQIQAYSRAASDQYSLGIVTYEWLCGERPFSGSSTEILAKHMMAPPPQLRPKVPSLPVDVEQIILIALAKDPGQRFSSIQAFATALQVAADGTAQTVKAYVGERNQPSLSSTIPPTLLAAPASQAAVEFQTPAASPLPPVTASSPVPPLSPMTTPSSVPPLSPMTTPQSILGESPKSRVQSKPSRRRLLIGLVMAGVIIGGGIAMLFLR